MTNLQLDFFLFHKTKRETSVIKSLFSGFVYFAVVLRTTFKCVSPRDAYLTDFRNNFKQPRLLRLIYSPIFLYAKGGKRVKRFFARANFGFYTKLQYL